VSAPASEALRGGAGSGFRVRLSALLAALIILLLTLLASLAVALVWREHQATLVRGDVQAQNAARTAAEHARWLIEANMQALSRLDDALGESPVPLWQAAGDDITELVEYVPEGTTISVVDSSGRTVLSSDPLSGRIQVADREYFQALQRGERTYISHLLNGRARGRKIFVVSRRIERNGEFLGAALSVVPVEVMSTFWETLNLGLDSSVGLIRQDGWLVARHPVPSDALDLSGHELFTKQLPQSPSGHYRSAASPADAIARIVGYQAVPGLPLIAVAGVSQEAVLGGFRRNLAIPLSVGIPLLVVLLALSFWGLKWLRREEHVRDQLAESVEQNRVLMREIHHRVKNNLQVVSSLVKMQPGPEEAKTEMARRIAAMAATYRHIYEGDRFDTVNLAEHARTIIDGLREEYGVSVGVEYDLEPLSVSTDVALPLALIISEVVANAFKHGFPDGRGGNLAVSLSCGSTETAILTIKDDGIGMAEAPKKGSLGMKLLSAFSQQLRGTHSFQGNGGTEFTLTFPMRDASPPNDRNREDAPAEAGKICPAARTGPASS
jgi:two-component system, sensor histidine kinase PdtaS